MKKTVRSTMKKMVTLILAVICICAVCTIFVGCQNKNIKDDYNNNYNSYSSSKSSNSYSSSKLTQSKAISTAKESSKVQDAIADKYGLKFFYTPDWGTVTATQESGGNWKVVLKGTISGYTDDYKTDFKYDKKFTATVKISSSGSVTSVSVSK